MAAPRQADAQQRAPQVGLVLVTVFLAYLGQMTLNPVIAPLSREVGLAEWQVGLMISTAAVMVVLTSQSWGRRSQSWGRKPVLVAAMLTATVAMALFALLAAFGMRGALTGVVLFVLFVVTRGVLFGTALAAMAPTAQAYIEQLEIKCTGPGQHARSLSGGNQQKVCLAKAFATEPELLFVSEPTRGIDVGAKRLVLESLERYNAERGTTIVVVSSELEELKSVADRIVIITEGKVFGIVPSDTPSADFGLLMSGETVMGGEA